MIQSISFQPQADDSMARHFYGVFMMITISLLSDNSHATTECDLLRRIMNRLGSEMSINRYIISKNSPIDRVEQASKELKEQNRSYKKAKSQYKKAKCKSVWDR